MTKLLILTPELPFPANQGASIRNLNILRGLSKNYVLDLLSQTSTPKVAIPEPLLELCSRAEFVKTPKRTTLRRSIDLISRIEPDLALRLNSSIFLAKLSLILREARKSERSDGPYEIVQIEGLELAFTIPTIKAVSPDSNIVYDAHNFETEIQRRALKTDIKSWRRWPGALYSYLQLRKLSRYEKWAVAETDWTVVVTESDRQKLGNMNPDARISVIPNSIDIESLRHDQDGQAYDVDLVFVGKMDYRPNVDAVLWFADKIWPKIRAVFPTVTLAIVGQKPHPRLENLKKLTGITVTGEVSSVKPYIRGAKIVIAPFRIGSGSRLKIIEAMAAKKAIVSTRIGAQGFDVRSGFHLLLVDGDREFAQSICRLLDDPEERDYLGENAGYYAEKYDWRRVVPLFEDVYRGIQIG